MRHGRWSSKAGLQAGVARTSDSMNLSGSSGCFMRIFWFFVIFFSKDSSSCRRLAGSSWRRGKRREAGGEGVQVERVCFDARAPG